MTEGGPVELPGTRSFLLDDEAGSTYRILLSVPDEPPPPGGYPALYLLDGGAFFGTLVEMVRLRRNRPAMTGVEAAIVVGVAHPEAHPYDRARRKREFTPGPAGTAELFRRFLSERLHPRIEADTAADPRRRILVGHSLAAAFALDTLTTTPDLHDGIVAVSPSIWAYRDRLFSAVDRLAQRPAALPHPSAVVVAVGEFDQALSPWQQRVPDPDALRTRRAERAMVDDARRWCVALDTALPDVAVTFEVLPGEDHASVLPVALSRAIQRVAGIRQD